MHQKPSIWRSWYPVVFQLIGLLVLFTIPVLPSFWLRGIAGITGVLVWAIGFGYRKPN